MQNNKFSKWCPEPIQRNHKIHRLHQSSLIIVVGFAVACSLLLASSMLSAFTQPAAVVPLIEQINSNPQITPTATPAPTQTVQINHNQNSPSSTSTSGPSQVTNSITPTPTPTASPTPAPGSGIYSHEPFPQFEQGYKQTSYMIESGVKVDGKYSYNTEWNETSAAYFGANCSFREKCFLNINENDCAEYIFVESSDFTNDSSDLWQLCIDSLPNAGSTPQTDDFRIDVVGHSVLNLYRGNGTGWVSAAPASGTLQWSDSLCSTPSLSTPHWVLEIRLQKTVYATGFNENNIASFGMRVAEFDGTTNALNAWPPTSRDTPNRWGMIQADIDMQYSSTQTNAFELQRNVAVDGRWTDNTEWSDTQGCYYGISAYFAQKYNASDMYFLLECSDSSSGLGDYVQICIDSNNDKSQTPQTDDYRVEIVNHTTAVWYRGNGTGWAVIPTPTQDLFTWGSYLSSYSTPTSPVLSNVHYIYELKINRAALGLTGNSEYGLLVASYDNGDLGFELQRWTATASNNNPSSWGSAQYTILL